MVGTVLAGGKSRRFGRNKAVELFQGERLIERQVRTLRSLFLEVMIVTNTPELYLDLDVTIVQHIIPERGPLGGIYTGLLFAQGESIFVTAVDLPFLQPGVIRRMVELFPGHDVVVPRLGDYLEPLHGIYSPVDHPLWDVTLFKWHPCLPRTGTYGIFFQHQSYGDRAGQIQVNLCIQGGYADLPDLTGWQWARTRRAVRRVLDGLMAGAKELIPGLGQAIEWEVRTASIYGLSESPGIAGRHRPSMIPPGIRNLYTVSDTVREAQGVGFQAVAHASLKLMEELFPNR